jgi:hypothetical protein
MDEPYHIFLFDDSLKALKAIDFKEFAVVVVDQSMPEIDGLDVLFIQDICFTFLKSLPFKSVWISHTASETSFSKLRIEQQGVEFGAMTPQQKSRLDRFLEECTIR